MARRPPPPPDEGIECLVCGDVFHQLATHVIRTHGFASADHYRTEFGLPHTGLTGSALRAKLRDLHSENLKHSGEATRLKPGDPRTGAPKNLSPIGRANSNAVLHARQERRRSQTHCKHGHPLSGDNVRLTKQGHHDGLQRRCRTCDREAKRSRRWRSVR